MSEIRYLIKGVWNETDRFRITSHTSWLGDLVLSEKEFNDVGRPTAGDEIILTLRPSNQSMRNDDV